MAEEISQEQEFEFRLRMDQEAEAKQAQAEMPSMGAVAGNAAMKGVASTVDMFGNAPTNAFNLGQGVIGYTAEALGHPEVWADRTYGTQPNLAHKGLTALGLIKPENEPQSMGQRVLDTAVQAGVGLAASPASGIMGVAKNAALGMASGAAASVTKEATGSDLLALAVGMAVPMALSGALSSRANAPTLVNPVKKTTLQESQAAGYIVNPSAIKPSTTTNRLESIAGKAAVKQEASLRNQTITNQLAAKSIGLPEDTILTPGALEDVRTQAGKAYEEVQQLNPSTILQGMKVKTMQERAMLPGPATGINVRKVNADPLMTGMNVQEIRNEQGILQGLKTRQVSQGQQPGALEGLKTTVTSRGQEIPGPLERLKVNVKETRGVNPLEELKDARAQATSYYKHYDRSADPASLKQAKQFSARANILENQIEQQALKAGKPELMPRLRAARQLIARTYDVERALNMGDGNVSATVIGRLLSQGRPLGGELKIIGKFAQAFPSVTREGAMIPASGVSGTEAGMSAVLGTLGYGAAGGPVGLMAAGLPLLRSPARSLLLSDMYQRRLLAEPPALNQAMLKSIVAGRAVATAR